MERTGKWQFTELTKFSTAKKRRGELNASNGREAVLGAESAENAFVIHDLATCGKDKSVKVSPVGALSITINS